MEQHQEILWTDGIYCAPPFSKSGMVRFPNVKIPTDVMVSALCNSICGALRVSSIRTWLFGPSESANRRSDVKGFRHFRLPELKRATVQSVHVGASSQQRKKRKKNENPLYGFFKENP